MTWSNEFVELDKAIHDRESFDCGKDNLNNFLKSEAARHRQVGISRTLLLPASEQLPNGKFPICAFFTITACHIERETLPKDKAKKLPRYPIPVFLLAQLAVHKEYTGQGLGKISLVTALEKFVEINSYIKAFAIIADCLDMDAENFYKKYGFEDLCIHNERQRLYLSMNRLVT